MFEIFGKKREFITGAVCRINQDIKRKSIIIHHYCPHTYNAGDHFVIHSIRKSLLKRLPHAVFIPKPCAMNRGWGKPVRLTGENINFSNRYADAVVIGGSDQYNGWSLRIKRDEIQNLAPPLYLIGLGISSKDLKSEPNIPEKDFLKDIAAANSFTRMSSVRDNRTYNFLKSIGVTKHVITGCPAMFLFNEHFTLKEKGYVLLTFPFPVVRGSNKQLYVEISKLIKELINYFNKKNIESLILCHDDRDVPPAMELFPNEKIFFSNYTEDYFPIYRDALMVIGTRLHATILAAGMGKPFININLDARGLGFTETLNLRNWNIDFEGTDIFKNISQRIDRVLYGDLDTFEKFYETKEALRSVYEQFIDEVSADIKSRLSLS